MIAMSFLERWSHLHTSDATIKRYASAKNAECTPIELHREESKGVFSGSHGQYITTLSECTCVDFYLQHQPCKHMYRLAMELGEIPGDYISDIAKIKKKVDDGMTLESAVETVETLSLDSQTVLREILLDLAYRNKPFHRIKKRLNYDELLASGLIVKTEDGKGFVTIGSIRKVQRNLCTYLGRRNEDDEYFDQDTNEWHSCPKGAQQRTHITMSPEGTKVISEVAFPEDKITFLLDKYGVNRCRNMPKEQK